MVPPLPTTKLFEATRPFQGFLIILKYVIRLRHFTNAPGKKGH